MFYIVFPFYRLVLFECTSDDIADKESDDERETDSAFPTFHSPAITESLSLPEQSAHQRFTVAFAESSNRFSAVTPIRCRRNSRSPCAQPHATDQGKHQYQ